MSYRNRFPRQSGILQRPRVHGLINQGLQQRLLMLLAGPGYGKTQAMVDYLNTSTAKILWIRLTSLDNLQSHFWDHLVQALAFEFPELADHFQAVAFPDTPSEFDVFIRVLKKGIAAEQQIIWVFDDFGEVVDSQILEFLRLLVEMELPNLHLVLISNRLDNTEVLASLPRKRALLLGKDLKFTQEEITALYSLYGIDLPREKIVEIEKYTEGWPLPLHLLAIQYNNAPDEIVLNGEISDHSISYMFEERFFYHYTKEQQKKLIQLSLLESFTRELAVEICQNDTEFLETLWKHPFVISIPAMNAYTFHNLYRLFLQDKRYMLSPEEEGILWQKAADYYASSDDNLELDAIACYRKAGDYNNMLNVMIDITWKHNGISEKNAAFFLEHLNSLSPKDIEKHPRADYLRAYIYLSTTQLEKARTLLLDLQTRFLDSKAPESRAFLGEIYILLGFVQMLDSQEDYGNYFKKAAALLPEGSKYQNKNRLSVLNNHSFSMPDNEPGTREKMEKAAHEAVPWISQVMNGSLSGMEFILSSEAAYLTYDFSSAEKNAYRGIYKAEANAQHDLVCNGYFLLARIEFMRGNYAGMTQHIKSIKDYAGRFNIGVLDEIRDTALGWYYIKLRDTNRVPKTILDLNYSDHPDVTFGRILIVYATYLISTGEYAKLIGLLEYPKGLSFSRGFWPDRTCLLIMLAIGYHRVGDDDDAIKALWTAYDMCYNNGLITLFVEAETHMQELITIARKQDTYHFLPDWLDLIDEKASHFTKVAADVRTAYKKQNPDLNKSKSPLSKRETEILQALSQGLTREEIAINYYISINSVKSTIRNIYNKLDVKNRAEAVSVAIARNYIAGYDSTESLL